MKHCSECTAFAQQVWDGIKNKHKGYYCTECGTFEKAIGREFKLPLESKHERLSTDTLNIIIDKK